jgi:hypothetical protein
MTHFLQFLLLEMLFVFAMNLFLQVQDSGE